ncbi:MAG: SDR family NAD(P)-dependent oxidoreductase [Alphaproteobacteria bacterium]|jgi:3-oxoacyl-[acyl-carrier protein] reductase
MIDFRGRIALVTGGSRGIGRATAIALGRAGANVAINFLTQEDAANEVALEIKNIGCNASIFQGDVSQSLEVDRMVAEISGKLGPIDILVNNAGQARRLSIDEVTEDDWEQTMSINLKSVFLVTRAVLPHMRAQKWGRIVNVSSGASMTGGSVGIHYSASKGGVDALSRAYASRLVKEGVTVNIVSPSLIDTDMIPDKLVAQNIPMGRLGLPQECADAIVQAASNGFMTGQTIFLNGGRYFG